MLLFSLYHAGTRRQLHNFAHRDSLIAGDIYIRHPITIQRVTKGDTLRKWFSEPRMSKNTHNITPGIKPSYYFAQLKQMHITQGHVERLQRFNIENSRRQIKQLDLQRHIWERRAEYVLFKLFRDQTSGFSRPLYGSRVMLHWIRIRSIVL